MWLYVVIAVLVLVSLVVQVLYLRAYSSQMNRTARVVMLVNIALLAALLFGVIWLGYAQAVR